MAELEEGFGAELVIVGVHSGKFIAERVTENIRQAVLRYDVRHPVVNDRRFRVWRSFAVNAWPTLTLIDPEGRVVRQQAGEPTAERLAPVVERVALEAEERGILDRSPLDFPLEQATEPPRPLAFPAKLLADAASGRLFISDTAHDRIVVVRLDQDARGGDAEAVAGVGSAGFVDGAFDDAAFDHPHGLALVGDLLYVADTGNHAIRAVDLARRRVDTIAGTGEQARRFNVAGRGRDVALNSPWDVLFYKGALLIAMAGSHQLWRLDPTSGEAAPLAGSGAEALLDGPLGDAALAQPSGLASDGERVFFADSEASAIRWAEPWPGGAVRTVVGTGLFDFGDQDGSGDEVRLQHPLGVAWHDGRIYVADTYNGRIKGVDPATRAVRTWVGEEGMLWEPGGLDISDGRVYIADTNHHRVAVVGLDTGEIHELEVRGL